MLTALMLCSLVQSKWMDSVYLMPKHVCEDADNTMITILLLQFKMSILLILKIHHMLMFTCLNNCIYVMCLCSNRVYEFISHYAPLHCTMTNKLPCIQYIRSFSDWQINQETCPCIFCSMSKSTHLLCPENPKQGLFLLFLHVHSEMLCGWEVIRFSLNDKSISQTQKSV